MTDYTEKLIFIAAVIVFAVVSASFLRGLYYILKLRELKKIM